MSKRRTVKLTGGRKLDRWLRKQRAVKTAPVAVTVGFHEPEIAALAKTHEFGAGAVPERPAFRAGLIDADRKFPTVAKAVLRPDRRHVVQVTKSEARTVGETMRETIRDSYLAGDHGPDVGKRQEARKRGTEGAGRQLVGHRGPRLADRLGVEVE